MRSCKKLRELSQADQKGFCAMGEGSEYVSSLFKPIRNLPNRDITSSTGVSIRSTVSRYSVCVVCSYEHSNALCIPPSCPQSTTATGGLTAANIVTVNVCVSTSVKIFSSPIRLLIALRTRAAVSGSVVGSRPSHSPYALA